MIAGELKVSISPKESIDPAKSPTIMIHKPKRGIFGIGDYDAIAFLRTLSRRQGWRKSKEVGQPTILKEYRMDRA